MTWDPMHHSWLNCDIDCDVFKSQVGRPNERADAEGEGEGPVEEPAACSLHPVKCIEESPETGNVETVETVG